MKHQPPSPTFNADSLREGLTQLVEYCEALDEQTQAIPSPILTEAQKDDLFKRAVARAGKPSDGCPLFELHSTPSFAIKEEKPSKRDIRKARASMSQEDLNILLALEAASTRAKR